MKINNISPKFHFLNSPCPPTLPSPPESVACLPLPAARSCTLVDLVCLASPDPGSFSTIRLRIPAVGLNYHCSGPHASSPSSFSYLTFACRLSNLRSSFAVLRASWHRTSFYLPSIALPCCCFFFFFFSPPHLSSFFSSLYSRECFYFVLREDATTLCLGHSESTEASRFLRDKPPLCFLLFYPLSKHAVEHCLRPLPQEQDQMRQRRY